MSALGDHLDAISPETVRPSAGYKRNRKKGRNKVEGLVQTKWMQ